MNIPGGKLFFFGVCGLAVLFSFASAPLAGGPSFHGSISDRYRFRSTGAFEDHDMEMLFTFDIGNPLADRFSGALQAGALFDLDGDGGGNSLSSVYDSFSNRSAGRLYYAYVDAKDLGFIHRVRAGRQHRYDFESLYFDGVTFESDPFYNLVLSTYGGVPVHLFENQIGDDPGDWMVGGNLEWNPLSKFLARFDYVHLKDSVAGFRAGAGDQEDDLLGLSAWWDISDKISVSSRFTSFSDQVRDVSARGVYNWVKKAFSVYVNVYRLLEGYDIRVIEWDAYRVAGTYRPYTEFSLGATKGFGEHFAVDGGGGFRFLDNKQVASAFNHGFGRFYLTLSSQEWPIKGMNVLKNNILGVSFQAEQKLLKDKMKLSAGTTFYAYRYNFLSGDESDNVQTYFVGVKGKMFKNVEGSVRYEIEDNNFNLFHKAEARLKWSF